MIPHIGEIDSIAAMPPWFIWLDPRSIGCTVEEATSFEGLSAERKLELSTRTQYAFDFLRDAQPAGVKGWMSLRRAAA